MPKTLNVKISVADFEAARSEFVFSYGLTMAEWASVERALYYWFEGITQMKQGMCRAVFYGAKGFGARAEMIESVIPFATTQTPDEIEFVREAIKKARNYSVFRNSIAHGEPIPVITDNGVHMVMGKAKDISDRNSEIAISEMNIAAQNFLDLAETTFSAIPRHRKGRALSEYLERIRSLPTQAHSKAAPSAPTRQKQSQEQGRVNKKAYRAAQKASAQEIDPNSKV